MTAMPCRGQYTEAARAERLDWLRQRTAQPLATLGPGVVAAEQLTGTIENFIGTVAVPLGLAGPLLFTGQAAEGSIVAPLATTEGALVASASRGARAITRCGGTTTRVLGQRMTRAPAYEFADVGAAAEFVDWLPGVRADMEDQVRQVSRYTRLVSVEPYQIGRYVHVLFGYETADAAGQNMTTAATWRICQWLGGLLSERPGGTPVRFFVEGNLSGDKKASHLSMIGGRGTRVTADCRLDRATIEEVLKTTPEAMMAAYHCSVQAAQQAGMLGFSVNATNVIAAMFIATGQDVACVHESGAAIFAVEPDGDGVRATMLLPNLVVGTVGGGTGLPQQRDLLTALGCDGDRYGRRLAEIVCGFALALDVSTAAAVSGGQFADAHQRLGRPRRVNWLGPDDLAEAVVAPMLRRAVAADQVTATVDTAGALGGAGILSDIAARGERRKLTGLHPVRAEYADAAGRRRRLRLVAKVKPLDEEVLVELGKLASLAGDRVRAAWRRYGRTAGFAGSHGRELAVYRSADPSLRAVLPRCYGVHEDPAREAYVVLLEDLRDGTALLDPPGTGASWRSRHVEAAIDGIAGVHAAWLGREADAATLGVADGLPALAGAGELWLALAEHNAVEHPGLMDADLLALVRGYAEDAAAWTAELSAMPRTLVHNDFNPRNLAFRRDGPLVAYDWELATWHVPQRDLAELLAFVLRPDASESDVDHWVTAHRDRLARRLGAAPDARLWRRGYRLALRDVALTRIQLYLMAHGHREYPFLERVVRTVHRLCAIEARRDAGLAVRHG